MKGIHVVPISLEVGRVTPCAPPLVQTNGAQGVARPISIMRDNSFWRILSLSCWFLTAALTARAGHPFLCTDSYGGKVCVVSVDGAVEWEYACTHHRSATNRVHRHNAQNNQATNL